MFVGQMTLYRKTWYQTNNPIGCHAAQGAKVSAAANVAAAGIFRLTFLPMLIGFLSCIHATRSHDTQHNDIQHNGIQHNNIQHNDTQHKDIQQ